MKIGISVEQNEWLRDFVGSDVTPLKSRDGTFCQRGGAWIGISGVTATWNWISSRYSFALTVLSRRNGRLILLQDCPRLWNNT